MQNAEINAKYFYQVTSGHKYALGGQIIGEYNNLYLVSCVLQTARGLSDSRMYVTRAAHVTNET